MNRAWLLLCTLVGCRTDTRLRDGDASWWAPLPDCAPTTFYEDLDGDGFGVPDTAVAGETCRPPDRHAERSGDCDDRASSVHPDAPEICDGRDNDCNGRVDDDDPGRVGGMDWYEDEDEDGYGTSALVASGLCVGPPASARLDGDCNDLRADVHPGRSEVLDDGLDNDCDGLVDLRGELLATWTVSLAEGHPEPGTRDCVEDWILDGLWAPELCPDCTLSFWVEVTLDDGAPGTACRLPFDGPFGLHVITSPDDLQYLGISVLYEGYTYYGYYGGVYGEPDEYVLHYMPEVPVTWDGHDLSFSWGAYDAPYTVGGEVRYFTNAWSGAGTVQ